MEKPLVRLAASACNVIFCFNVFLISFPHRFHISKQYLLAFYAELILSLSLHLFEWDRNTKLCEYNMCFYFVVVIDVWTLCMSELMTHTHRYSWIITWRHKYWKLIVFSHLARRYILTCKRVVLSSVIWAICFGAQIWIFSTSLGMRWATELMPSIAGVMSAVAARLLS